MILEVHIPDHRRPKGLVLVNVVVPQDEEPVAMATSFAGGVCLGGVPKVAVKRIDEPRQFGRKKKVSAA